MAWPSLARLRALVSYPPSSRRNEANCRRDQPAQNFRTKPNSAENCEIPARQLAVIHVRRVGPPSFSTMSKSRAHEITPPTIGRATPDRSRRQQDGHEDAKGMEEREEGFSDQGRILGASSCSWRSSRQSFFEQPNEAKLRCRLRNPCSEDSEGFSSMTVTWPGARDQAPYYKARDSAPPGAPSPLGIFRRLAPLKMRADQSKERRFHPSRLSAAPLLRD
jgi:hypothetical protein